MNHLALNRRDWLGTTAGSLSLALSGIAGAADSKPPRVAMILTEFTYRSHAHVIVENFRPDVKHRLKFDYETLRIINPRLIYTSISAFGQDGPYKDRPGVDQVVQGMSGLMSVTGEPGRGPMRVGILGAGYADGIFHRLSNRGKVIAAGKLTPILGTISMGLTTIDLSHTTALGPGDEVTLLGGEGDSSLDAQQIARVAGTISYNILCSISSRVRRVYI